MTWERFKEIVEAKGVRGDTDIDWINWRDIDRRGEDHEPQIIWWEIDGAIAIE